MWREIWLLAQLRFKRKIDGAERIDNSKVIARYPSAVIISNEYTLSHDSLDCRNGGCGSSTNITGYFISGDKQFRKLSLMFRDGTRYRVTFRHLERARNESATDPIIVAKERADEGEGKREREKSEEIITEHAQADWACVRWVSTMKASSWL